MTIIAVTGLEREARMVSRSGAVTLACGGHRIVLRESLERAIAQGADGIISIGIGGGLIPTLKPGDVVVASSIIAGERRFGVDDAWAARLMALLPGAIHAPIAGSDSMVTTADAKAALCRTSGAHAVDMESHIAAQAAETHGIAFAALRVVTDAAERDLPQAVLVALKPDGKVNIAAVLRSLAVRPWQIANLIRAARDSEIAFAALLRCCDRLGRGLAGPDFV